MAASDPLRLTLPADPSSVGAARRHVRAAVDGVLDDSLVDDALVVTSELVTNAVLHAGTDLELVVVVDDRSVRIEVHDGDPRIPRRKRYSASSGTGRGLVLVESLATVAGVDRGEDGKVVWAVFGDLPVEPAAVLVASADTNRPVHGSTDPTALAGDAADDELQVAASDDSPALRARAGAVLVGAT